MTNFRKSSRKLSTRFGSIQFTIKLPRRLFHSPLIPRALVLQITPTLEIPLCRRLSYTWGYDFIIKPLNLVSNFFNLIQGGPFRSGESWCKATSTDQCPISNDLITLHVSCYVYSNTALHTVTYYDIGPILTCSFLYILYSDCSEVFQWTWTQDAPKTGPSTTM